MDEGAKAAFEGLKVCLGRLRTVAGVVPISLSSALEALLATVKSYRCTGEMREAYETIVLASANLALGASEGAANMFVESLQW